MQRHAATFEHRAALAQRQAAVRIEDDVESASIVLRVEGAIINDLVDTECPCFFRFGRRNSCRRSRRRESGRFAPPCVRPHRGSLR